MTPGIERPIVFVCRLREPNFQKSSLADFGGDARSFAGDREGYCVGRAWCGRTVAGGLVALGRTVPKRDILNRPSFEDPTKRDDDDVHKRII